MVEEEEYPLLVGDPEAIARKAARILMDVCKVNNDHYWEIDDLSGDFDEVCFVYLVCKRCNAFVHLDGCRDARADAKGRTTYFDKPLREIYPIPKPKKREEKGE